jgi:hypothetical protein
MNIAYTEVPLRITAKTCGHELEACKRLLKYPSASLHKADEDTIKKEIDELAMTLDLLP